MSLLNKCVIIMSLSNTSNGGTCESWDPLHEPQGGWCGNRHQAVLTFDATSGPWERRGCHSGYPKDVQAENHTDSVNDAVHSADLRNAQMTALCWCSRHLVEMHLAYWTPMGCSFCNRQFPKYLLSRGG